MISNFEEFFTEASAVLDSLSRFLQALELDSLVLADHICFKCESKEEFEQMRKLFEGNSTYIFQSIISQRRIAVIKFVKPLETVLGPITVLELSDQKPNGSQKSGFDHVEIYPISETVEEVAKYLGQKGIVVEKDSKPHHTTWDFFVDDFRIRIEEEPLIEKIKREEML